MTDSALRHSDTLDDLYQEVVDDMREAARAAGVGEISTERAHRAARNLIGFYQTLLEIKREQGQGRGNEQCS